MEELHTRKVLEGISTIAHCKEHRVGTEIVYEIALSIGNCVSNEDPVLVRRSDTRVWEWHTRNVLYGASTNCTIYRTSAERWSHTQYAEYGGVMHVWNVDPAWGSDTHTSWQRVITTTVTLIAYTVWYAQCLCGSNNVTMKIPYSTRVWGSSSSTVYCTPVL